MRKLTVAIIVLTIVLGIGGCVWAVVYCNGNPQARLCQSECDPEDWAEGDEDCEGLEGPNAEDVEGVDYDKPKKPAPKQPTQQKPNTSNKVRK